MKMKGKSLNNFKRNTNSKKDNDRNMKFQKSQKKSSMSYSSNKFSESERNKNSKYTRLNKNNPNQTDKKFDQNIKNYDKRPKFLSEKNCEDLIWGKHSVLSVLERERPVNRIWCTPEIRSSEKFFQILKDVKSKGVLIEEVPWSRISQITFGAVHQGIALQLSLIHI